MLAITEPMEVDRHSTVLDSSKITVLRGHSSEVFTCAWSPMANIIVSGCVREWLCEEVVVTCILHFQVRRFHCTTVASP